MKGDIDVKMGHSYVSNGFDASARGLLERLVYDLQYHFHALQIVGSLGVLLALVADLFLDS